MKLRDIKNLQLKMQLVDREISLNDDVAGLIEMLACVAGDIIEDDVPGAAACIEECRLLAAELIAA